MAEPIVFATTDGRSAGRPIALLPEYANRHGCISGATGTGKTVTLQKLAEGFSRLGVPVFLSDVKGDLSGIAKAGVPSAKTKTRLAKTGVPEPAWEGNPVTFWDVFGEQGHPVRATVSDMGPLLIARLLQLNDTQEGVLNAVFKIADDNGLLLLDMKDLRSMLSYVGSNAKEFRPKYGNISSASIGAIQRGLLALESQGGDKFFGEPMLDIGDLMQTVDGKGVVNILAADKLMLSPKLYGTFLLWILSELYENLPEVGDQEKPKLVFFFDEAHLLFKDAPAALMEKIELVVRLIRSKGVGVYFVTQNPLDIPETILGQLGNRVQHALRAFTPRDQKAVKTAADTMRPNKDLNIAAAITELGVGEALVSMLGEGGTPGITERCWIGCPGSQIGPVTKRERKAIMADSLVAGVYEEEIDRESAYEKLQSGVKPSAAETKAPASRARTTAASSRATAPAAEAKTPATRKTPAPAADAAPAAPSEPEEESGVTDKLADGLKDILFGSTGPRGGRREGLLESMAKSAVRQAGNKIVRGILGSIMGGK